MKETGDRGALLAGHPEIARTGKLYEWKQGDVTSTYPVSRMTLNYSGLSMSAAE